MKSCALICVVGWLAFWVFGGVAVLENSLSTNQLIVATLLAFAGMMAGMFSYLKLCRECR